MCGVWWCSLLQIRFVLCYLVTFFPILKSIFDEQNIGEDNSGYPIFIF